MYNDGVQYFAPWQKCNTFCIPFYDSYDSVQFMKYSRLFFTLSTQFVLEAKILRKVFLENKGGFWAFEMLEDKAHDHTEKWLFSGAIIWQYRTQIPELVFFCFHHHLVLLIVILPSDKNAKFFLSLIMLTSICIFSIQFPIHLVRCW